MTGLASDNGPSACIGICFVDDEQVWIARADVPPAPRVNKLETNESIQQNAAHSSEIHIEVTSAGAGVLPSMMTTSAN